MAALPAFSGVMATSIETVLLTGEFPPESFGGVLLTGNAFNFLGVPPAAGRTLQPSDIRSDGGSEPVVVLSHRLWLRLFQGSADAVGKTLRLNDRPHTIVGVMPPRFGWYGNEGFWLPLSLTRKDVPLVAPIVRLAPGVSKEAAEEQLRAFHQRLAPGHPRRLPVAGIHDGAAELPRRDGGERRDADQSAAAAWRGRVPAADRLRERREPPARARHRARQGDGGSDVDRRGPGPASPPAAHRKRCSCRSPAA